MGRPQGAVATDWNPVLRNQLSRLVGAGHSPDEVARRMGLSISAIKAQAKRQELEFARQPGSKWLPGEDDTLEELANAGLNAQQIAKRMTGREPEGVYSRARELRKRGRQLPLPKLDRSRTQNRSVEDESVIGRRGLTAMSLPLHRLAEAFSQGEQSDGA